MLRFTPSAKRARKLTDTDMTSAWAAPSPAQPIRSPTRKSSAPAPIAMTARAALYPRGCWLIQPVHDLPVCGDNSFSLGGLDHLPSEIGPRAGFGCKRLPCRDHFLAFSPETDHRKRRLREHSVRLLHSGGCGLNDLKFATAVGLSYLPHSLRLPYSSQP